MEKRLIGQISVRENIRLTERPSYQVYRQLYEKQKRAAWFPEEPNIHQDALDCHLLPDEKDLFDTAFGYFCSSELLDPDQFILSPVD